MSENNSIFVIDKEIMTMNNIDKIKKFGEFCNIHHNKVNETEIKRNTMSPINVGELKMLDEQIIQHTISELELHYWTEVSGAIEHYFKKHNGYPMPNTMASKILQVPEDQITLSKKDLVHYDRPIGPDKEIFTKMIFGIKSEEIFQEAMDAVENYYDFMNEVNKMVNESKETKYSIKQAIYIIENLYRMHEEDGINELTTNWNDALRESMKALKSVKEKTQTIEDYIQYGEYLLSDMQVLTLNVIQ